MYIEFSNKFATSLGGLNPSDVINILDRARLSAYDGCHIVTCESKGAAEEIRKFVKKQNNSVIESFFCQIIDDIHELNAIKNNVSIYVSIISQKTTNLLKDSSASKPEKIEIGIDIVKTPDFWRKISFLTENTHDAMLYEWIASYEKEKKKTLGKIDVCTERINGGGATTHDKLLEISNGKRFILCFLDSDKKDPKQKNYGATASKFDKEKDISKMVFYYVMRAHELENLFFSYDFFSGLPKTKKGTVDKSQNRKFKTIFDKVCEAEKNESDFRFFFDVKNGYDKKTALEIPYVKNALKVNVFCNKKKCSCSFKCEECTQPEIEGFSSHYLDYIESKYASHQKLNKTNFFADAKKLTELQKQEWEIMGNLLFSWACAYTCRSRGI